MEARDRIKQKAEELFRRYGIKSITMDEIAGQLAISKKTIYQYYADKHELVEAVITDVITQSRHTCQADVQRSGNAVHEVFLIMDMMKEMFSNMNPVILYDMERAHPKAFQKFLEHKHDFIYKTIKANLERGIEEGLFRPEIDVNVISKLRLETTMMAFNPEIFPTIKTNLLQVEHQLIEHFLFGVANLKGHKLILKYQQDRIKKENKDEKAKAK